MSLTEASFLFGCLVFSTSCFADGEIDNVASKYAGCFIGGGVEYQDIRSDWNLDDNLGTFYAMNPYRNFGNVPGLGPVIAVPDGIFDIHGHDVGRSRKSGLGCFITAGYGILSQDYYWGCFITVDISKSRKSTKENRISPRMSFGKSEAKTSGSSISVGIKFGRLFREQDFLLYLKVGGCNFRTDLNTEVRDIRAKRSEISPMMGLGFEKSISSEVCMNIEFEYLLGGNKSFTLPNIGGRDGRMVKIENKYRRCIFRVGCSYHIN